MATTPTSKPHSSPRFYCDARPNDAGARQIPYVVIDRHMLESAPQDDGVVARFAFNDDAEAFRDLKREQMGEQAPKAGGECTETIKARDLREGHRVKAPSAPAWSTIRSVRLEPLDAPERVTAIFDWGWLVYEIDEPVEIQAFKIGTGS